MARKASYRDTPSNLPSRGRPGPRAPLPPPMLEGGAPRWGEVSPLHPLSPQRPLPPAPATPSAHYPQRLAPTATPQRLEGPIKDVTPFGPLGY